MDLLLYKHNDTIDGDFTIGEMYKATIEKGEGCYITDNNGKEVFINKTDLFKYFTLNFKKI